MRTDLLGNKDPYEALIDIVAEFSGATRVEVRMCMESFDWKHKLLALLDEFTTARRRTYERMSEICEQWQRRYTEMQVERNRLLDDLKTIHDQQLNFYKERTNGSCIRTSLER